MWYKWYNGKEKEKRIKNIEKGDEEEWVHNLF